MELVLMGFPLSGKTTAFNALTHRQSVAASRGGGSGVATVGMARVPDARIEALSAIFHPQRRVPAEIRYVDTQGLGEGRRQGSALGGELVNALQGADALVHVVRAFDDPAVPLPEGAVTPEEAVASMDLELVLVDLGILERRAQRLQASMKGARSSDRAGFLREQEVMERVRSSLEQEVPVHHQALPPEDRAVLAQYNLVTAKPMLVVFNLGEERLAEAPEWESRWQPRLAEAGRRAMAMCGKLEMELAQLGPEEEAEFRRSLGAGEPGRERVARASFDLLDLISFFTVGEDEVRAWPVARESPAVRAAGKVHSDMERGFIRAEVVACQELLAAGGMAEARKAGRVRLEGKEYRVKDGDVITFLFNV